MKKTLVLYYSKTGSNRYLAERIARELACDIERIRPRLNLFPFLLLSGALGKGLGSAAPAHDLSVYERIVLVGPVWMGQVVSPLQDMIKRIKNTAAELRFVTCCGSVDEKKDEKFGYGQVFDKMEKLATPKRVTCSAFPIVLVIPEDKKNDDQAMMNTRLSDANFTGEILERFNSLIASLKT